MASALIIPTKFAPPRVSTRSVARVQLLHRLQQVRQCSLVLVTGGAGFGKTTVLAQWHKELMKSGATVAWLSLAQEDGQLASFCANLVGALQKANVPIDDDWLLLPSSDRSESLQATSAALIEALTRVGAEVYLVIDDFHHVEDRRTLKLMQSLIEWCPGHVHVVIASRASPNIPLGRLRASGQLGEIECAELSFDFRESLSLVKANLGDAIDMDDAHLIHELTDGWAIGMQLVCIALKADPKARTRLRTLVARTGNLREYLAEDVIGHLPPTLVDFMEKVSILRRFNAELAEFLTGVPDGAAMIADIEQRNLFIFPVDMDDRFQWYRLHPLFGAFLTERLASNAEKTGHLHLRASHWFADHGLFAEAIRHASLSNDLDLAIELIDRAAPTTRDLSHIRPFLRLIERMPLPKLATRPRLLLLGCWTYVMTLRPNKAELWLEQLPQQSADASGLDAAAQITLLRAAIAGEREDIQRMLALIEPLAEVLLSDLFLGHVRTMLWIIGLSLTGRYAEVRKFLHSAAAKATLSSNDEMALIAAMAAVTSALSEGDVVAAERIGSETLARAEAAHGRRSAAASWCAGVLADALYELGRIDDAREVLANRLDMIHCSPTVVPIAVVCYGRLQLLQESARAALAFLEEEEGRFRAIGLDRPTAYVLAEQARINLEIGDLRRAATLLAALDDLAGRNRRADGFGGEIPAVASLTRARVALAEHKPERALEELEQARSYCVKFGRERLLVTSDLLRVFAFLRLKRHEEATCALTLALASGNRLGLVRTFVDEGRSLAEAMAVLSAGKDGPSAEYRQCIEAHFVEARPAKRKPAPASEAPQFPDAVSLTPRERDILTLLEQSMSNKRIAAALNISLETTKWNLKNIFAKLGVTSRYEAIVFARAHGTSEGGQR